MMYKKPCDYTNCIFNSGYTCCNSLKATKIVSIFNCTGFMPIKSVESTKSNSEHYAESFLAVMKLHRDFPMDFLGSITNWMSFMGNFSEEQNEEMNSILMRYNEIINEGR